MAQNSWARRSKPRFPPLREPPEGPPMRILGVPTLGHSTAVALVDEQNVLFAIEEEKLTRLQDTSEIPRLALDRCLHENRLKLSDCRAIALAERPAGNAKTRNSKKHGAHASSQQ